jgi:hypothetical protein
METCQRRSFTDYYKRISNHLAPVSGGGLDPGRSLSRVLDTVRSDKLRLSAADRATIVGVIHN